MSVKIVEDIFGRAKNPTTKQTDDIKRFTFTNDNNVSVQVITLGATITTIKVPDICGRIDDVVLGYDDIPGYQTKTNPYFGATVGRVCNRIGNGTFILNGKQINVNKNFNNKHQLHGGFVGFDKAHWNGIIENDTVSMMHISPDGDEGYPGELHAKVIFKLTPDNSFHVNFSATTTKPTIINLTNHSYFNLGGHSSGSNEIYEHFIKINADKYTLTDDDSIPTGELQNVEGTAFDLRTLGKLGPRMQQLYTGGFDNNFCVNLENNKTTVIAKVMHPKSGRFMEVATDQPGVQFYTSNHIADPETKDEPIYGKNGAKYYKHAAFCLETQKYPDAINHENFPSIILNPGENYSHEVVYMFGAANGDDNACKK